MDDHIGGILIEYIQSTLAKFLRSDAGVTAVEYALIAAGIAVAISVVVKTLGNSVSTVLQSVVGKL
jgi:pilus assembly protein Flp/PilA